MIEFKLVEDEQCDDCGCDDVPLSDFQRHDVFELDKKIYLCRYCANSIRPSDARDIRNILSQMFNVLEARLLEAIEQRGNN